MSGIFKDLGFMYQEGSLAAPDTLKFGDLTPQQVIDSVIPPVLDADVDGVMTINSSAFIKASTANTNTINDIFNDNSCVVTYPLDSNADSLSGLYNGTATNVTYASGKFGNAAVFNGISSLITIPGNTITSKIASISFWVKCINNGADMNKFIHTNSITYGSLGVSDTGVVWLPISGNGNGYGVFWDRTKLTDNNWHHIVIIMNNISITAYIDNVFIGTGTSSSNYGYDTGYGSDIVFGSQSPTWLRRLNGSLDQVRIFNKALTQSEITTLYTETTNIEYCANTNDILGDGSCIATYPLDSNVNSLTGLYNGTATNVTYSTGKFGNAAVFNGINSTNYINNINLTPNDLKMSVSLWVKGSSLINSTTTPANIICAVNNAYYWLGTWSNNLQLVIKNSAGTDTLINYAVSNFNSTSWYHLCFTMNGVNNAFNLYVNSVLVGSALAPSTLYSSGTYNTCIGFARPSSPYQFFNGSIDQVRIFNKSLSQDEVTIVYNENKPLKTKQPLVISQDPAQNNWKKVTIKSFSATGNVTVNSNVLTPKTTGSNYIIYDDLYPDARSLTLDYTGSIDHLEITTYI